MSNYKTTVGIEVHVELNTTTKMFSSALNSTNQVANSNICAIDLGYPGTLPTLNKEAIRKAIQASYVLNCEINRHMHFDRKNYFYPDLPKGYQITQARTPIGVDGYIMLDDGKKIGIHDVHIEEDTAKSVHFDDVSLLDFNRAGVPLIEIVSCADMHSSEDAINYLNTLRERLFYAGISDVKMEEGSMRCDVNISISNSEKLGTRVEVKNVGSISSVGKCIKSEALRQQRLLEEGLEVGYETRRYDEASDTTVLMRVKEDGNDYRYFPEADIPYVTLEDDFVEGAISLIPVMPDVRRNLYLDSGISLINANKIISNKDFSDFLLDMDCNLIIASNLLLSDIASYLNKKNVRLDDTSITRDNFKKVVDLLDKGKINNKLFKEIVPNLMEDDSDIMKVINEKNSDVINDPKELVEIVDKILADNSSSVLDFKNGKDRALKFLMGQIMKNTRGKADPVVANKVLKDQLSKY